MKTLFTHILYVVGILALAGMLAACSDEPETAVTRNGSTASVDSPAGRAVLVYLLADNSLGQDGYDRANLAEMIDAAKDGRLGGNRLIIYHDDRKASHPMLKEVTPKGLKILKEYDNNLKSTSVERMRQAIADFKTVAPANRYGLVFWSHATGWPFANPPQNTEGIKPTWVGEDRGNYMEVTDLSAALHGQGFDYVYFDCCYMASVEALYELRDVADWFVASAAELPAEGMPYYQALPYLMANDPDMIAAAATTFAKYDNLSGIDRTSTMSVVKSSALEDLAAATRDIYDAGVSVNPSYIGQPFQRTSYGSRCYLFDFEDYILNLQFSAASQQQAASLESRWEAALNEAVVYHASTPWIFNSIKVDKHCGLTSYILRSPEDANNCGYRSLQWYTDVASHFYN